MIKKIIEWTAGSFFRTLGKLLLYVAIGLLLLLLFNGKVNAASYELQNNGTTMYFNPSGSASIKWDTLYYDSASDRAPYRFNAKVESISSNTDNGNPFVFDGTYLIDFYIYGIGSFYSNYNCTDFTSNFSYVSPTTGSTVSNANNISSSCVDVYKTTYANNNAIHILYKFKLATESYDTGTSEFTFNIYKYNFFNMLSTGFNYGLHVGSINSYSEDVVSSFSEQKNDQTIINQNQTIIDQNTEAETTRKGIWDTIKEVSNLIVNLPLKLVELLIDALKSLFVPTEEQLQDIIDKSSEFAENFGFVGETMDFFINMFTSFLGMVNAEGCIVFPKFEMGATTLFEAHTFWEERTVCLADNKILNDNIDTIRTITSIVFVCMFLGFASRQFFSILSKNDSGVDTTYNSDGSVSETSWSRVNGDTTRYRKRTK